MIYDDDNIHDALEKIAIEVATGKQGVTVSGRRSSITVNPLERSASAAVKKRLTPKLSLVGEGTASPEYRYGGLKLTGSLGGKRK
jgi:hypothetical protein